MSGKHVVSHPTVCVFLQRWATRDRGEGWESARVANISKKASDWLASGSEQKPDEEKGQMQGTRHLHLHCLRCGLHIPCIHIVPLPLQLLLQLPCRQSHIFLEPTCSHFNTLPAANQPRWPKRKTTRATVYTPASPPFTLLFPLLLSLVLSILLHFRERISKSRAHKAQGVSEKSHSSVLLKRIHFCFSSRFACDSIATCYSLVAV